MIPLSDSFRDFKDTFFKVYNVSPNPAFWEQWNGLEWETKFSLYWDSRHYDQSPSAYRFEDRDLSVKERTLCGQILSFAPGFRKPVIKCKKILTLDVEGVRRYLNEVSAFIHSMQAKRAARVSMEVGSSSASKAIVTFSVSSADEDASEGVQILESSISPQSKRGTLRTRRKRMLSDFEPKGVEEGLSSRKMKEVATSDTFGTEEGDSRPQVAPLLDGNVWEWNGLRKEHNYPVLDSLLYTPSDRIVIEDLGSLKGHLDMTIRRCLVTTSLMRHFQEVVLPESEELAVLLAAAEEKVRVAEEGRRKAEEELERVKKELEEEKAARRAAEDFWGSP